MKKVIIFGDFPITTKVCEFIAKQKDVDVVGIVIGNPSPKNNDPVLFWRIGGIFNLFNYQKELGE